MVRVVDNKAIQYAISKLSMIVLVMEQITVCIPVPGNFVHLAELLVHAVAPVRKLTVVIG